MSYPKTLAVHDALILRMAPTHTYDQIARHIRVIDPPGWPLKQVRTRGYKLGIKRQPDTRGEIPVPIRLPTPDDGAVAALVERWAA